MPKVLISTASPGIIRKEINANPAVGHAIGSAVMGIVDLSLLKKYQAVHRQGHQSFIIDTFTNDYNILRAHQIIHAYLETDATSQEEKIQKEIEDLNVIISNVGKKHSIIDVKYAIKRKEELSNSLQEASAKLHEYTHRISPYLQKYRGLPDVPPSDPFSTQEPKIDFARLRVILGFLDVAREYFNINVTQVMKSRNVCNYCSGELTDDVDAEGGISVCKQCSTIHTLAVKPTSCREGGNRNDFYANTGANDYDPEENASLAFDCYQGTEVIPDKARNVKEIKEYLQAKKQIKDLAKVDYQTLYEAISETNPKLYRHIRHLGREICGWVLPDISHLKEQFLEFNRITDSSYEELSPEHKEGRTSSLNVGYKSYRILHDRLGHPCKPSDFKIPKTPDILQYHEKIHQLICKKNKWQPGQRIIL